jgi:nucleoside-diphosphate-sugar epimerase
MRVFVTGGTGHAGSYIIPELIAAGHEVTGAPVLRVSRDSHPGPFGTLDFGFLFKQ